MVESEIKLDIAAMCAPLLHNTHVGNLIVTINIDEY